MRSTFKLLFYIKRNAAKKDGTVPVVARITIDGKIAQFNTKLSIIPQNWSIETGKATGRSREASEINSLLEEIKTRVHKIYHDLTAKYPTVTAEKVKNTFLGIGTEQHLLLKLFEKCNSQHKKQIGISKSKATYQKYEVCKRHLSSYIKSEYHLSDLDIREINHSFITGFEVFLKTRCKCGHNTTAKFIQKFKSVVLVARKNGWLLTDPFDNYKIIIKKVDRGFLTEDELKRIIEKKFSVERLERVRDLFIFACYTGLPYADIANLTQDNIVKLFDGNDWIVKNRQKTDIKSLIPLLDIPKLILKKYKGLPNGKLLPVLSNQKTNAYLKEIGDVCGIKKNLTFHLARHTFATTITLSKGVPIESVSKMLGHTNIQTTQIYARITNEKISNDMQALAGKLAESQMNYAQL